VLWFDGLQLTVFFISAKEGQPRYASMKWVKQLGEVVSKSSNNMSLAAHFCGTRVNEVLVGDDSFLKTLPALGFKRVQINATAVNGVDTSNLGGSVQTVAKLISQNKGLEFILQKNEETRPLWEGMLTSSEGECGPEGGLPDNVSMLLDESKGTGVLSSSWPTPPKQYEIGYAVSIY
jgi:hypothetical protein